MTNDPGAALSLLCLGTGLGLPAQAVHCFAAHPAQSGTPFSGNRLNAERRRSFQQPSVDDLDSYLDEFIRVRGSVRSRGDAGCRDRGAIVDPA
jgi:hypothetical protein